MLEVWDFSVMVKKDNPKPDLHVVTIIGFIQSKWLNMDLSLQSHLNYVHWVLLGTTIREGISKPCTQVID